MSAAGDRSPGSEMSSLTGFLSVWVQLRLRALSVSEEFNWCWKVYTRAKRLRAFCNLNQHGAETEDVALKIQAAMEQICTPDGQKETVSNKKNFQTLV